MNKKITIENAKGQNIVCQIEKPENDIKGWAVLQHGLSGYKEQTHLQTMTQSFLECGYATINFDCIGSFGESDGYIFDVTTSTYLDDLETVVAYFEKEGVLEAPFILAGHSLGSASLLLFSQKYPEKIKALAPTSTVLSYDLYLSFKMQNDPQGTKEWQDNGYYMKTSASRPDRSGRVSWALVEDLKNHDILGHVDKITMPTLLVVGNGDDSTPVEHQKILFDALSCPKEFHVIKNCGHTFKTPEQLAELKNIFVNWLTHISG